MREILFRGKRLDNGDWVEGMLTAQGKKIAQIGTFSDYGTHICCNSSYAVIPETVEPYTGLTDKNGTKIFEGDILCECPPMNKTAYIGYVAYDDELAVWRFMIKNDTRYNGVLLGSYSNSYKIIGNIHDNPELLKEMGCE